MLLRKLKFALVAYLLILLLGTIGYRVLEGWSWLDSAWMMLTTITTPSTRRGRTVDVGCPPKGCTPGGAGTLPTARNSAAAPYSLQPRA